MINTEAIPALAASVKPDARLHLNSPHTYYGEPAAGPVTSEIKAEIFGATIEEHYYYINHTHLPVTVSRRDGLPMVVGPTRSSITSDFIIRRVLVLKTLSLQSAVAALTAMSDVNNKELEELKRCFKHVGAHHREASIMLDYAVSVKDMQSKGGSVYHYQLDVALSFNDAVTAPAHPYSHRFANVGGFGETHRYADQKELNLKIRYVDHSPTACKKYINIAGKVFALTPQKDAPYGRISARVAGKATERIYPDYLEVYYSANADPNVVDNTGVGHMRVAIEEAKETIGLYGTYDDAKNAGNIEATRKEKLNRMLHETEVMKANIARERAKLDQDELKYRTEMIEAKRLLEIEQGRIAQEQATLDRDRRQLEQQRKIQDDQLERERREHQERITALREERESKYRQEQMHWKEFYEMRQLTRRDNSDLIKYIPALMLAGVSVWAAWMKVSSQVRAA